MLNDTVPTGAASIGLKSAIETRLAAALGLAEADVFAPDLTLAEIISAAPGLVNSVDFMECCAKVANALRKENGVSIRLPATSLDTHISVIVDSFVAQASLTNGREL